MDAVRSGYPAAATGRAGTPGRARTRAGADRYKRVFDLCALACLFVALLPVWIALCVAIVLAIRIEGGGPVLYRQVRLGRDGRPFRILKFRTIPEGVPDPDAGPVSAARRDARTSPVGRMLRRFHLDELPQVVNVVRGEMSLVGPRPERPALAARIEREVPGFPRRLRVLPGIMGLAQAHCLYDCHPRRKLDYDELYIRRMSPWLDIRLIGACAMRALAGQRRARDHRFPRARAAASVDLPAPPEDPREADGRALQCRLAAPARPGLEPAGRIERPGPPFANTDCRTSDRHAGHPTAHGARRGDRGAAGAPRGDEARAAPRGTGRIDAARPPAPAVARRPSAPR